MADAGQPATGTQTETTQTGTSGTTQETTQSGTQQEEESFFDPSSIQDKPELVSAYKNMQRAFSKKTKEYKSMSSELSDKARAYDSFMANPQQEIRRLAQQYGMTISEATTAVQQQQGNFQPKDWNDVFSMAENRVLQKLQPVLNQVQQARMSQIESTLDEHDPEWRNYEDAMMSTLKSHPSLASDPIKLYRLSVPEDVLHSKATQTALKKLQNKVEASKSSGGSTATGQTSNKPKGKLSFAEAAEYARKKLASEGKSR